MILYKYKSISKKKFIPDHVFTYLLLFFRSGTVERQWPSFVYGGKCEARIVFRAVSLVQERNALTLTSNDLHAHRMYWNENVSLHDELTMRDKILNSICPDVYGLIPLKLAIVLAVCSSGSTSNESKSDGSEQRHHSHVLIVGDPGMAKSKLLLSAAVIAPRAIHTTGAGCSAPGLTAAAVHVISISLKTFKIE